MKLNNIRIRFYLGANVRETDKLSLITLAIFVKATKEGECGEYKFQTICNTIREVMVPCRAANNISKEIKDKIRTQKKNYPFITPSIYGENGSKMAGYKFNGLASFDADVADNMALLDIEYRDNMKRKLMDVPNMIYVAASPSGGIKMLMFISIYQNEKEYKQAYAVILNYIQIKTGLVLDRATSAPNQNMFIPYDPEVLFDDKKYVLNREELMTLIGETLIDPAQSSNKNSNPIGQQLPISDDVSENLTKADWYVNQLLDQGIDATATYNDFIGLCFSFASLGEDARIIWLRLCSLYAKYNQEECDAKFTHCLAKHDGRRNIGSFFWECENRYRLLPYSTANNEHTNNGSPIEASRIVSHRGTSDAHPEQGIDNDMFLRPYLFNGIEDMVPRLIKDLMLQYSNPRQKDIIALTLINSISGMFSNLKVAHFNKICHVNTCAVIVAPAGAGKGVAVEGRSIIAPLDEYIYQQSLKELLEWNAEEEINRSSDAPLLRYYLMPLDSTNAAFINFLLASKGTGAIIETEMSVGNTIGKQWDSVKPLILKNFQNEDYDVNRKGTGLKRVKLHFGFTMTNTPASALSMISHSDGMLSRMVIYSFNECTDLDDCTFDFSKAFESKNFIEKAGEYIREMYIGVPENPEMIYGWSVEGQEKLLEFFRAVRERTLKIFGNDLDAGIKRTALTASRYGAIFAFLDDYESRNLTFDSAVGIRLIPDKYIDIVIKLMNRFLWHSRTFYDSLEKSNPVIDSKSNRIYHILRFLPTEFKLQDLGKAFLDKVQISAKTLERRINDCCEKGFLEKVKHGVYRKTDKCPKM